MSVLEAKLARHDTRIRNIEKCETRYPATPLVEDAVAPGVVILSVEDIQDLPSDGGKTDGMAISFVDDQDCGFFGKSSSCLSLNRGGATHGFIRSIVKYRLHEAYNSGNR